MNNRQIKATLSLILISALQAGVIDTVSTNSQAMDKTFNSVIVLPDSYLNSGNDYPVVYLLHGYGGGPFDWQNHIDLAPLADEFEAIIVCPDGDKNSWYLDSPMVKESQYATYIGRELVRWIDDKYRTIPGKSGRAISGLSMGGHGALYLALQNPDEYCAVSSMSGGVDLTYSSKKWEIAEKIGSYDEFLDRWQNNSIVNLGVKFADQHIEILIDCGTEDIFIENNRQLHQALLSADIDHEYVEKAGNHSWDYWTAALSEHLQFFSTAFTADTVASKVHSVIETNLLGLLDSAIADSAWPGAVLLAIHDDQTVIREARGYHTYQNQKPTQIDDIFDLASITKVIATTSATMHLYEDGRLSLNDKIIKYIPEFRGKHWWGDRHKAKVRIKHLLTHTSGLPPFKQYYKIEGDIQTRLDSVYSTPLERKPGKETVYSDIGIIILGKIIESITGTTLDSFVTDQIFKTLGMNATGYIPDRKLYYRIVPTEINPDGILTHGYVHDENAHSLGGVAGHAGLFSTSDDLANFARMMLNSGELNGIRIFQKETVDLFTRPANIVAGSSRCLGWDSPSGRASGGVYLSDNSFGHTGFTGTSLWIDPDNDIIVILLTNAVHPNRSWKSPEYFDWRQRIHSAVYEELGFDTLNPNLIWRDRWQKNIIEELQY